MNELKKKNEALSKLNIELGKEGLEREELICKLKVKVEELLKINKELMDKLEKATIKQSDLITDQTWREKERCMQSLIDRQRHRNDQCTEECERLEKENITLTKRLSALTESETIVIEEGEVKAGQKNLDKFLGTDLHLTDIYTSGPIGAPISLATEIAKMLNKETVGKVLKESGGKATIKSIAEATQSSAKAVYRFLKKTPGFSVGELSEPDYKEENTDAWLEGQQGSKSKVKSDADAAEHVEDVESSEESGDTAKDEGNEEGSEDDEGGNWGSS